jgi:hypothetical protein
MGCSNVGCVLTGLEIRNRDRVYAILISKDSTEFIGHYLSVPPILGLYNDYDGINVTEDASLLGYPEVSQFPEEGFDDDFYGVAFINADVYESLEDLPVFHPFENLTMGAYVDEKLASIGKDLSVFDAIPSTKSPEDLYKKRLTHVLDLINPNFSSDWFTAHNCVMGNENDERTFTATSAEDALKFMRRAKLLKTAEMHLRQPIMPMSWGPQDLDEKARLAFYETTTQLLRERVASDT